MRARLPISATTALAALLLATGYAPLAVSQASGVQRAESAGTLSEVAATPSAEQIFSRHVQAIGGREAVLSIAAMQTAGKMEMPAQGISASVQSVVSSGKSAARITIPGIGDITNGYDGQVAWEVNPLRGPRVKTEKEAATAQEDADFRATMLFARERYSSVESVGQVEFGGEKTWHVKTVLKSGRVVNEYFSVATGLKVGSQSTSESQAGSVNVTTLDLDYKQFGSIKLATRTEMTTGAQKVIVTLTDVHLGPLPDSAFALPDAVKALVKP